MSFRYRRSNNSKLLTLMQLKETVNQNDIFLSKKVEHFFLTSECLLGKKNLYHPEYEVHSSFILGL